MLVNPLRKLPKRYASGHKAEELRERRLAKEEELEILRILDGGKLIARERSFILKEQPSLKLLFILAIETGMRMAEIHTLTVSQVDIANKTIFLNRTISGDTRQVLLSSVAIEALQKYLPNPDWNDDMFPWASEKAT